MACSDPSVALVLHDVWRDLGWYEMSSAFDIATQLRGRIVSGLHLELLAPGDRLAGVREVAQEFDADPRTVLAAYRALAAEGMVSIRPRSGIYVAEAVHGGGAGLEPLRRWFVEVLGRGIESGIGVQDLARHIRRAVATVRLRAACIECNTDQMHSTMHELRADYGIDPVAVYTQDISKRQGDALPREISSSDIVITTVFHARLARSLAARAGKPCVVVSVNPEMVARASSVLRRESVYFVVSDPRFARKLPRFFASVPDVGRVRAVVVGRDDLSRIPAAARVYVMGKARALLRGRSIPGRVIPNVRVFSPESARELLTLIVRLNSEAQDDETSEVRRT